MIKRKKYLRICLWTTLSLVLLVVVVLGYVNLLVVETAKGRIISSQEAATLKDVDCILVLGCGVSENGTPSAMLNDRLRRGVELYDLGAAPKLLMSGDHGKENYDEVNVMKAYAVGKSVADSDVFMDHAGFSTYESLARAKEIFQAQKIIIVTQQYHLYRAVYIAEALGLEAYGVSADYRNYAAQTTREVREILARVKDFATALFQPNPTYLGDVIPIFGDGNLTNDENSDFS